MKVSFRLLSNIKSETTLIKPIFQLVQNFCCQRFALHFKSMMESVGFRSTWFSLPEDVAFWTHKDESSLVFNFLRQGGSSRFDTSLNWSLDTPFFFEHRLNFYARPCSWVAARLNRSGTIGLHVFVYLTYSWSSPPNLLCSTFLSLSFQVYSRQ